MPAGLYASSALACPRDCRIYGAEQSHTDVDETRAVEVLQMIPYIILPIVDFHASLPFI